MNVYREAFLNIKKFPPVFWLVIAATLINQMGNMAFVFLLLYVTQHLGFSLYQGALSFAVISGSMLLSGIISGNLIDHLGAPRIMIAAIILNGVILITFPLIHHYYLIIFFCFLWGLFYGIYRPASQTFVSYLSREGLHKITFSVYRLAVNLGMSIGPAVGGYLVIRSFPAIFIVNGLANLFAGILLILGLVRTTWILHKPVAKEKKLLSLTWLKKDAALRWFLIGLVPISMVFYQHESTLPVYLKNDLGLSLSLYGWLFTINTLMIVFLELPFNVASLNWPYRYNFILGSVFIAAGFGGLYFASAAWHIILGTVIWTIGEMILFPAATSYLAEIAPEGHRGSYMSLFTASTNMGMLLGPWAGALVMQQIGGSAVWVFCGLLGLISIAIFNTLIDAKSQVQEPVLHKKSAL